MNQQIRLPKTEMEAHSVIWNIVGDFENVDVTDNLVSEITDGIGIVICSSTVMLGLTSIKNCPIGGLLVKSSEYDRNEPALD